VKQSLVYYNVPLHENCVKGKWRSIEIAGKRQRKKSKAKKKKARLLLRTNNSNNITSVFKLEKDI
jgi:hypothetical protein